jgi:hypothetical protein
MPAVYPVNWIPVGFRAAYPHMAKRDQVVWERFLALYAGNFEAVAYDVAIGGATLTAPGVPQDQLDGWRYTTALKIDACLRTADSVVVVEVRPEAHVSALGSVLAYCMVAERDQVFDLPTRPAIVCETVQGDVGWCCQALNVQVYAMPTALGPGGVAIPSPSAPSSSAA